MLLHTGRSGLRPSDLCLFNTDLYRGPFPNNTPMNATQAILMRNPWAIIYLTCQKKSSRYTHGSISARLKSVKVAYFFSSRAWRSFIASGRLAELGYLSMIA